MGTVTWAMKSSEDTVEAAKRLATEIGRPSIGVNLDYGNIIDFKEHPSLEDCVTTLGSMI